MPIQSTDTTSQLFTDQPNQTWIIKPLVDVFTTNATAVFSTGVRTIVINHGGITGGKAVELRGSNATLHNTATGTIVSETGTAVQFFGSETNTLTNDGSIYGPVKAVEAISYSSNPSGHVAISNTGSIESADTAIFVRSGSITSSIISNAGYIGAKGTALDLNAAEGIALRVINTGTIEAGNGLIFPEPDARAIWMVSRGLLDLVNSGTIVGDVRGAGENDQVRNTGSIAGKVLLGAGDDRYDGKGGEVAGVIDGRAGADRLIGAAGDSLHGNLGRDILKGGKGAQSFVYKSVGESDPGAASRDVIRDFRSRQGDVIDLSAIEGKFHFIGTDEFSGDKGELRYKVFGDKVVIQGDKNGDDKADFDIELTRVHKLHADDFVL